MIYVLMVDSMYSTPSLHGEQGLVGGDELQVRRGGHVVVSLQRGQVAVAESACGLVELLAHLHAAVLDGVIHLHVVQKPLGHDGQGIVRPALWEL